MRSTGRKERAKPRLFGQRSRSVGYITINASASACLDISPRIDVSTQRSNLKFGAPFRSDIAPASAPFYIDLQVWQYCIVLRNLPHSRLYDHKMSDCLPQSLDDILTSERARTSYHQRSESECLGGLVCRTNGRWRRWRNVMSQIVGSVGRSNRGDIANASLVILCIVCSYNIMKARVIGKRALRIFVGE